MEHCYGNTSVENREKSMVNILDLFFLDGGSTLEACSIQEKDICQWPSIYIPPRQTSPKLYNLVCSLKSAQEYPFKATAINSEIKEKSPLKRLPSCTVTRNSEVARKFYASMRRSSECQNSSSLDSWNDELSLTSTAPSYNTDETKRDENLRLFRTPEFFQAIPNTGKKIN